MPPVLTRRQALLTGASVVLATNFPSAFASISGWRSATFLPLAVQEIYPAALGGRIYLAGGLYAENGEVRGATDQHFSWAPGETAWQEETTLPQRRHHPNLVSSGDRVYALGGFDTRAVALDWTMTAETLIYDPNQKSWTVGPTAPEPHGETVCIARDQLIHVVGGRIPQGEANQRWTDQIDTDRHLVLDPAGGTWDRAAPALVKRNSAAGARLGDAIHVVGGRQVGGGNLTAHEVYDPREDRWRNAAPMPQGQGGLAAAVLKGRLYAFGGEFFDNDGGVYPEAWVYDPQADQWTAIEDMPTPRHGLGAVTLEEEIYVIGGAKGVGGDRTSAAVEVYRPS